MNPGLLLAPWTADDADYYETMPAEVTAQLPAPVRCAALVADRPAGRVWRVSLHDGRTLALKYTQSDPNGAGGVGPHAGHLAAREAAVLHTMISDSPNLVERGYLQCHGRTSDGSWIAVQWYHNPNLYQTSHRARRPPAEDHKLMLQAAHAIAVVLARLHARGWHHGDLQARHVLYVRGRARLIDYAWAQGPVGIFPSMAYRGGWVPVTAPEIADALLNSPPDHNVEMTSAAEVCTFAAVLYHLWTGQHIRTLPHGQPPDPARLYRAICDEQTLRPADLERPRGIRQLLAEMAAHDPAKRPCIDEVRDRLYWPTARSRHPARSPPTPSATTTPTITRTDHTLMIAAEELDRRLAALVDGRRTAAEHTRAWARGGRVASLLVVGSLAGHDADPFSDVDLLIVTDDHDRDIDLGQLIGKPILAAVQRPRPRPYEMDSSALCAAVADTILWFKFHSWTARYARAPADALIQFDRVGLPYTADSFAALLDTYSPIRTPGPISAARQLLQIAVGAKRLSRRACDHNRRPITTGEAVSEYADRLRDRLSAVSETDAAAAVAGTAVLVDLAEAACLARLTSGCGGKDRSACPYTARCLQLGVRPVPPSAHGREREAGQCPSGRADDDQITTAPVPPPNAGTPAGRPGPPAQSSSRPGDIALTTPPKPLRERRWLLPTVSAMSVLAVLTAAFLLWRPSPSAYGDTKPTASPSPPASTARSSGWIEHGSIIEPIQDELAALPTAIAHPQLLPIADALTESASDRQTGPVQYVRYEYWARDNDEMAPFGVRSWLRADYSAVSEKRKLPNRPPNFDPAQIGHTDFSTARPGIVQTEGKDIIAFAQPLPADEHALMDRIRIIDRDGHLALQDVLGIVRWANEVQVPSLATRKAIIRLLAHLPGLTVIPDARDRAGRPGIAVTWHDTLDAADLTYIFSATTGELLSYDQMMTDRPLGGPTIKVPALAEAQLFYERARTHSAS